MASNSLVIITGEEEEESQQRRAVSAEGTKIWGPALKDLDRLERLVNPHYIESGKIWGAMAPLFPPALERASA